MNADKKVLWVTTAVVVAAVIALMVSSGVEEKLAPRPVAAWLAIEAPGAGVAISEPLELAAGGSFTLHAVLEAKSLSGESVYYTEADALEIGGQRIPSDALRRWKRPETLRILWFTVEGISPYMELDTVTGPDSIPFQENYRSDWPMTWSIPGDLEPSSERLKPADERRLDSGFGTQRFHLRIEIFGPESQIVPRHRFSTSSATDVFSASPSFPRVTAALRGSLAGPSRLFGLTQIALPDESASEAGALLDEWSRRLLVFSRATAVRSLLSDAGARYTDLDWAEIELTGALDWSQDGVLPGDMVRVGERLVFLFEDRGRQGVLDYGDLCFDFDKGANVRMLSDVFVGEGVVELARLPRDVVGAGDTG